MKIDNRKDILLLLLFSPGVGQNVNEPIKGRTRLIKMLFLFRHEVLEEFKKGTEINQDNFYNFIPWNFGPFSREIYDDLVFFTLRGFIEYSEVDEEALEESAEEYEHWADSAGFQFGNDNINEFQEQEFKLSEKGVKYSSMIYNQLNENQRKLLQVFKSKLQQAPLRSLLRYVYKTYPQLTSKSIIRDDIL